MPFYLTIREGKSPEDSQPIFATADPDIIKLVANGLYKKLGGDLGERRLIRLKRDTEKQHGEPAA